MSLYPNIQTNQFGNYFDSNSEGTNNEIISIVCKQENGQHLHIRAEINPGENDHEYRQSAVDQICSLNGIRIGTYLPSPFTDVGSSQPDTSRF